MTDSRVFFATAFVAWCVIAWVVGSSVYGSSMGVLFETSLWLPHAYQLSNYRQPDFLSFLLFIGSISIGSRASIALLSKPMGSYEAPSSRQLEGAIRRSEGSDLFSWFLTGPFSTGAQRCLLVFVVLATLQFPYREHELAEAEQRQITARVASWLDIDSDDVDRYQVDSDFDLVYYRLMGGDLPVTPFLSCAGGSARDFPFPEDECSPQALKEHFDKARKRWLALDAKVNDLRSNHEVFQPRPWLPLLIVIWIAGAIVITRVEAQGSARASG